MTEWKPWLDWVFRGSGNEDLGVWVGSPTHTSFLMAINCRDAHLRHREKYDCPGTPGSSHSCPEAAARLGFLRGAVPLCWPHLTPGEAAFTGQDEDPVYVFRRTGRLEPGTKKSVLSSRQDGLIKPLLAPSSPETQLRMFGTKKPKWLPPALSLHWAATCPHLWSLSCWRGQQGRGAGGRGDTAGWRATALFPYLLDKMTSSLAVCVARTPE